LLQLFASYQHAALEGQLVSRQTEGLFGHFRRHALHFVQHAAGLDNSYPTFWRALTFTHPDFRRLAGNGLVWKHANPDTTTTLDVAGHGDTGCLDLPLGEPARLQGLQAVLTNRQLVAALGLTPHASLEPLAIFYFAG